MRTRWELNKANITFCGFHLQYFVQTLCLSKPTGWVQTLHRLTVCITVVTTVTLTFLQQDKDLLCLEKNMSEKTTTEQGQGCGSHYIYEDKQFTPCLHFCLHLNSKGGQMAFDFLWLSRNMHHCSPDTSIQIHSYLDAFLVWMALPWPPVTLWRINYFWPRMFSLTRKLRKPSFLYRVNRRHPFSEWCWNTCSYISF